MKTAMVTINCTCSRCSTKIELSVDEKDIARYKSGELIQNCFPYLSADQREILISGICGTCFDELFAEPDDVS